MSIGVIDSHLIEQSIMCNGTLLCVLHCVNIVLYLKGLCLYILHTVQKITIMLRLYACTVYMYIDGKCAHLCINCLSNVYVLVGSGIGHESVLGLVDKWKNRYPDPKMDSILVWDDIITNRLICNCVLYTECVYNICCTLMHYNIYIYNYVLCIN